MTTTTPLTFGPADLAALQTAHPEVRVIDVRTPAEYAAAHVPGSVNVPLPDLDEHRAELTAPGAGPTVLVCRSGRRAAAAEAQLRKAGLTEMHVLDGGVEEWIRHGHPVRALHDVGGWSIERQVRGVAGALVASSIAVSIAWPPARFLAGAIGAGLFFAAVSDPCAMGNLGGRLPHTRRTGGSCDLRSIVSTLPEPDAYERSAEEVAS